MDDAPPTAALRSPWHKNLWILGLSGAVLLALSFPPADLWPLAWIALLPWLRLIAIDELPKFSRDEVNSVRSKSWVRRSLNNISSIPKRPYGIIYLCALIHWLMVLHWLRLPYWATGIGGFFLCAYCAGYIPLFVGLSRVAVHRWRLPLPLVAALVWMGLEYMRQWFLSGFAMACLAHTQYRFYSLIQVAEFGGATLVSGLILLPAAWLAEFLWIKNRAMTAHLLSGMTIVAVFVATLLHGQKSLQRELKQSLPAIIVQGNIDTMFDGNRMTDEQVMEHYEQLTDRAFERASGLRVAKPLIHVADNPLVIWPESMFRIPYLTFEADVDPRQLGYASSRQCSQRIVDYLRHRFHVVMDSESSLDFLLGTERLHFVKGNANPLHFNSAIAGNSYNGFPEADVYSKQHLVPFGEYVPLGDSIPFFSAMMPFQGLSAGEKAVAIKHSSGIRYSVSICYESVMPQVTRRQMLELRERNETPAALINLTNDGWFWGSSELDLHLVCGVFRAVEARRPFLIAANTGMSAAIDPLGRITAKGERHKPDTLFVHAQVLAGQDSNFLTFYHRYGELPGMVGLAFSVLVLAYSIFSRNEKPT